MARAGKVCSETGCATISPQAGRCAEHQRQYVNANDARRASSPYNTAAHARFRRAVLARDPVCMRCRRALSTIADHYPHSRKQLIDMNLNPNDPTYGRGLCKRCHDTETAVHQPGGWNYRPSNA